MTFAHWLLFGGLLTIGGLVAFVWLCQRAPYVDDWAAALTFDEHAAVAAALLQPDVALFTATDEAQIAFAAEWLDYVNSLPTAPTKDSL